MRIFRKQSSGAARDDQLQVPTEQQDVMVRMTGKKAMRGWSGLRISVLVNLVLALLGLVAVAGLATLDLTNNSPQFCANCHIMEKNVQSYLTSSNMDNVHKRANVGCKDCHDYSIPQELESGIKFITGDFQPELRRRKFNDSMCNQCHISLTYVAQQTDYLRRNPHLNHWPNLRCGVCHISHGEQVDYCNQCHDNGGQRMTGAPIVPRAENPWADPARERPDVSLP